VQSQAVYYAWLRSLRWGFGYTFRIHAREAFILFGYAQKLSEGEYRVSWQPTLAARRRILSQDKEQIYIGTEFTVCFKNGFSEEISLLTPSMALYRLQRQVFAIDSSTRRIQFRSTPSVISFCPNGIGF
jgi:hypothetical protein